MRGECDERVPKLRRALGARADEPRLRHERCAALPRESDPEANQKCANTSGSQVTRPCYNTLAPKVHVHKWPGSTNFGQRALGRHRGWIGLGLDRGLTCIEPSLGPKSTINAPSYLRSAVAALGVQSVSLASHMDESRKDVGALTVHETFRDES